MNKVLIIAEAGVNHNGSMEMAKQLIEKAADAGADLVKFQTFKAKNLVTKDALRAEYQIKSDKDKDISQYNMLKGLELTNENHLELIRHCENCGIGFFSTAFDLDGLAYLNEIGLQKFKVPSGEITNYPYLKKLAEIGKPVILSSGMSTLNEIKEALQILTSGELSNADVTILHCNTEYPTPMQDVNLHAMNTIRRELDVSVGYSDHTMGIEIPVAAVALGASVIEKHFTLNKSLPGPDHRASLEPDELKAMVEAVRNIEMAISGNGTKSPSKSEFKNKNLIRKSIYTSKDLRVGDYLSETNLLTLRPGDGISPMKWNYVIGKRLTRSLKAFSKLKSEDFSE